MLLLLVKVTLAETINFELTECVNGGERIEKYE